MKKTKTELDKAYIKKIKDCKEENKKLSKELSNLQEEIDLNYSPIIEQLHIKVADQHKDYAAAQRQIELTKGQLFTIARAYRGLIIMQNDAKSMGIDVDAIDLPEDEPYEGFKMSSKILESGKTVWTASATPKKGSKKKIQEILKKTKDPHDNT